MNAITKPMTAVLFFYGALVFAMCLILSATLACEATDDPDPTEGSDCGDLCIRLQACSEANDFLDQFESDNDCNAQCEDVEGDGTTECLFNCAQRNSDCGTFLDCVAGC